MNMINPIMQNKFKTTMCNRKREKKKCAEALARGQRDNSGKGIIGKIKSRRQVVKNPDMLCYIETVTSFQSA